MSETQTVETRSDARTEPVTLADLSRSDLPPVLPFKVACTALGLGQTAGYGMERAGIFPVPVIRLSPGKWVVPTAPLQRFLGIGGGAA